MPHPRLPLLGVIPIFWRGQILFWASLSLFGLVARLLIYEDLAIALVLTAIMEPAAVLLVAGLRVFYLPVAQTPALPGRTLLWIVLLCVAAALAEIALGGLVRVLFGWPVPDGRLLRWTVLPFGYYVVVFVGWSLLYFWVSASIAERRQRERAAALEVAAVRTELERLRLQLDPHLIFNALNGMSVEIPDRPEVALAMLHDLADYLRMSLQNAQRSVGPVTEEVAIVEAFLAIQKARFGERLGWQLQIEPAALDRQLPSFVLQLLVENAIKHGLRADGQELLVVASVSADQDRLQVQVRQRGALRPDWREGGSPGIGLANLRRRLQLHYPGRHRFALRQQDEHVVAELCCEGRPCFG